MRGYQRLNFGHHDIGGRWPERGIPGDSVSQYTYYPLSFPIGFDAGDNEDYPVAPGKDTINAYCIVNPRMRVFNKALIRVTSSYSGTGIRFGIYTNKKAGCYPDKLIWESSEFATIAVGIVTQSFSSFRLPPGIYWIAWKANAEPMTAAVRGADSNFKQIPNVFGKQAIDSNLMARGFAYQAAHTYGALPPTFPNYDFIVSRACYIHFKLT